MTTFEQYQLRKLASLATEAYSECRGKFDDDPTDQENLVGIIAAALAALNVIEAELSHMSK